MVLPSADGPPSVAFPHTWRCFSALRVAHTLPVAIGAWDPGISATRTPMPLMSVRWLWQRLAWVGHLRAQVGAWHIGLSRPMWATIGASESKTWAIPDITFQKTPNYISNHASIKCVWLPIRVVRLVYNAISAGVVWYKIQWLLKPKQIYPVFLLSRDCGTRFLEISFWRHTTGPNLCSCSHGERVFWTSQQQISYI